MWMAIIGEHENEIALGPFPHEIEAYAALGHYWTERHHEIAEPARVEEV